jgi:prophage regulatory protein
VPDSTERIIDRRERRQLVPYSDVHVRRLEQTGAFPKRVQLGPNRVGWLLSEVQTWIQLRAANRDS